MQSADRNYRVFSLLRTASPQTGPSETRASMCGGGTGSVAPRTMTSAWEESRRVSWSVAWTTSQVASPGWLQLSYQMPPTTTTDNDDT